jgi:uncharacterized protein YndB with AHSA1/START domain
MVAYFSPAWYHATKGLHMNTATDRIERSIHLKAPRSRVWRAITNAEEFGGWFGANLKGQTFAPGKPTKGPITYPGYEHVMFDVVVEHMEPERIFSWRWHPAAIEPDVDYSHEPRTLVVFELADADGGTHLTITESGFDKIPPERRLGAFRLNSGGWDGQLRNIEKHVTTP